MKTGRNDPCPCGSGKKFKKCCELKEASPTEAAPGPARSSAGMLQEAIDHHQAGRLGNAERLYRSILEKRPNDADALHLLGIICHQIGNLVEAETMIKRAIAVDSKAAMFHVNLGNVLKQRGRRDDAMASFRKALSLQPDLAEAHYNLANELYANNHIEKAIMHYIKALRTNPRMAEAHYNLGIALQTQDRIPEAISSYSRAVAIQPDHHNAHYNLGILFQEMKRYRDAAVHYDRALKFDPDNAQAHYYLGNAYLELDQYDAAEASFRSAIALRPDFADAHNDLSVALRKQGRTENARASALRSLEIAPSFAAYNNLGITYREDGRIEDAIENAEKAIAFQPDSPEVHWNLALALLHHGELTRGWQKYEWRALKTDSTLRTFPYPRWDGSPLKDRTLFIFSEQGVGDQIMFASLFPDIIRREPTHCIVDCDPRLVPLFARSFPEVTVIPAAKETLMDGLPAIDLAIPMGSLPLHFRPELKSFPQQHSFLVPDAEKVELWTSRFKRLGTGLKVGISWRGGKDASVRTLRSTTLAQWSGLFSMPGLQFVNLQYGDCAQELQNAKKDLGVTIHHWDDADPLKDLDGFAAQIAALDLVISVDNATVHMAGALGIPTLALLPRGSDWRWMRDVDDTPWYSSVRLFRQVEHSRWDDVFARVRTNILMRLEHREYTENINRSYRNSDAFAQHPVKVVGLLNDTTYWYHWGCTGTSTAIHDAISQKGYSINRIPITGIHLCTHSPRSLEDFDNPVFYRKFAEANSWLISELKAADIIVVNGEGSIHGINPFVLTLLYLVYVSKVHLKKQVQIINHSCYPDDSPNMRDTSAWAIYKKVYSIADYVAIREPVSHGLLISEGIRAEESFDCLPLHIRDTYDPAGASRHNAIVIAGSAIFQDALLPFLVRYLQTLHRKGHALKVLIGANMLPAHDDELFVKGLTAACPGIWSLVDAGSMRSWLDTISGASLLVSGRFHHTIAAAMVGTPCILLGTNTPKNAALSQVLGIDPPMPWDALEIDDKLVALTEDALKQPEQFRVKREVLTTLCGLAEKNFFGLDLNWSKSIVEEFIQPASGSASKK